MKYKVVCKQQVSLRSVLRASSCLVDTFIHVRTNWSYPHVPTKHRFPKELSRLLRVHFLHYLICLASIVLPGRYLHTCTYRLILSPRPNKTSFSEGTFTPPSGSFLALLFFLPGDSIFVVVAAVVAVMLLWCCRCRRNLWLVVKRSSLN